MTSIVHISDLHFGTENPAVVSALEQRISEIAPDLVVVSGDLTQRARSAQFEAAAAFLDGLESTALVVPGNHDIPLWNVARRLFRPFSKWHGSFTSPTNFQHEHGNNIFLGVNTARSTTISEGQMSGAQADGILDELAKDQHANVVLVTHHPLIQRANGKTKTGVLNRDRVAQLCDAGLDLLLSGHHHNGLAEAIRIGKRSVVICAAGTAVSTRHRGEVNSFNEIEISGADLSITKYACETKKFERSEETFFVKLEDGWHVDSPDADTVSE